MRLYIESCRVVIGFRKMIVFYFGNTSSVSLKLIEKILECLNRYENIIIIRDKHVGEFRKKYKGWWMGTVRSSAFQSLPSDGRS